DTTRSSADYVEIVHYHSIVDSDIRYFLEQNKIIKRINTLQDVGLGYLTLGKTTSSLSGGEVQRLKLASHLQKEGQIYILDEPSLGLHTKDNQKLIDVFQNIINKGNTIINIQNN